MKLSLSLIVKAADEEASQLKSLLDSAAEYFDELNITITGKNKAVEKVAKEYKAKISYFDWVDDFAAARNYNFSQATGDWIMWLDSDDLLRGGEHLRKNVELADKHNVTGLSTVYNYSHDEQGVVKDSHWKLQVVKNGYYEWKGVVHEELLPIKETKGATIKDVVRVHTATDEDNEASLYRNIKILEKAIKDDPKEPRHYFYAARCYLGTEDWDKVIEVITTYLTLSDWPAERYDALNMMGEAYTRLEDYDTAIKTHQQAILELEDAPDAYIFKARNYIQKEEWYNAITNLMIAESRDKEAVILKRAALYDHDLYVMSAICFMQLGMYSQAVQAAQKANTNRPSKRSKEILELSQQMNADEVLTTQYYSIGKSLVSDKEALKKLVDTIPNHIKDDPRLLSLQFAAQETKVWPKGSIVYFCGNSLEAWDGNSVYTGGIGGSETAVIELSKRWAKAGREVVVYNRCDAPAGGVLIDGVRYMNYWEFNKQDRFDTVIIWRSTQNVDLIENADHIYLDLHDVTPEFLLSEERLAKIDKVYVKTNYHRSLYPNVPDDKFEILGNGVDSKRFETDIASESKRFIYTSSANRGLENILDVWPEIRKRVPKAELHIFYGWNTFVEAHKHNPTTMAWVDSMKKKMEQDGVKNHGRVDQSTLAQEMQKSSLWLYPTDFPEIHCITALEMQLAGCYPITTGFAALAETQQSGVKIPGDPTSDEWRERFVNEVEMAVKNPDMYQDEIKKGKEYAKSCDWNNIATLWKL